jgi:SAM-dependent methyltransferase
MVPNMDIKALYQGKLQEAGEPNHQALGYVSEQNQTRRYRAIAQALYMPGHPQMDEVASVLDVGCGFGDFAEWWPRHKYVGVDVVPEFIREAVKQWGEGGDWLVRPQFICADFGKDDVVANVFDVVTAVGTFAWQDPFVVQELLEKMWVSTKHVMAFTLSKVASLSWLTTYMSTIGINKYIVRHDLDIIPEETVVYCYR